MVCISDAETYHISSSSFRQRLFISKSERLEVMNRTPWGPLRHRQCGAFGADNRENVNSGKNSAAFPIGACSPYSGRCHSTRRDGRLSRCASIGPMRNPHLFQLIGAGPTGVELAGTICWSVLSAPSCSTVSTLPGKPYAPNYPLTRS